MSKNSEGIFYLINNFIAVRNQELFLTSIKHYLNRQKKSEWIWHEKEDLFVLWTHECIQWFPLQFAFVFVVLDILMTYSM